MEPTKEITTTPTGSDTVGVGGEHDVVPVVPPSSSDDGQRMVRETGIMPDRATAEIIEVREQITVPTTDTL